jgi:hypothetical protein
MIRNGHSAHTVGSSLLYQLIYATLTIEQRIVRMNVKMNKIVQGLSTFLKG